MQIVVNHLTRMRTGSRICVAGVDPETFDHIRPVTPAADPITRELLREEGGPFSIGALVELGRVRAVPSPPESEDHQFATANARHVQDLTSEEYWRMLEALKVDSIHA